jgi:hypothetical protein
MHPRMHPNRRPSYKTGQIRLEPTSRAVGKDSGVMRIEQGVYDAWSNMAVDGSLPTGWTEHVVERIPLLLTTIPPEHIINPSLRVQQHKQLNMDMHVIS